MINATNHARTIIPDFRPEIWHLVKGNDLQIISPAQRALKKSVT